MTSPPPPTAPEGEVMPFWFADWRPDDVPISEWQLFWNECTANFRALPPLAAQAGAETYETGWLIERPDRSQSIRWVTLRAGTDGPYTTDPEKALRFARRQDADDYASLFGDEEVACKIVEHAWVGSKT